MPYCSERPIALQKLTSWNSARRQFGPNILNSPRAWSTKRTTVSSSASTDREMTGIGAYVRMCLAASTPSGGPLQADVREDRFELGRIDIGNRVFARDRSHPEPGVERTRAYECSP